MSYAIAVTDTDIAYATLQIDDTDLVGLPPAFSLLEEEFLVSEKTRLLFASDAQLLAYYGITDERSANGL